MGSNWSSPAIEYPIRLSKSILGTIGRKRKRDEESDDEVDPMINEAMHTPKRKMLVTTAHYIYQTLFKEGINSDVTVVALGKEWKLHKVYLAQSPYFNSMFSGSWKESMESHVNIQIEDPNINLDALFVVLGSLYRDEFVLKPAEVVPVLAAATLFQLDGIITECIEIMKDSTNVQTVVSYYNTSCQYGVPLVKEACLNWLKVNLLSNMMDFPKKLRDISPSLMSLLVGSPDLFVMQTEFSVYIMLKFWLFLQLHPTWEGNFSDGLPEAQKYFQSRKGQEAFLDSSAGELYRKAFGKLRLPHLVNHHIDLEVIHSDNIIPSRWLGPVIEQQWYQMLRIDQGVDKGPKEVSSAEFLEESLRCGRTILTEGHHCWRWTGFNFGLDVIMNLTNRKLKIRRNHRADCTALLSHQPSRHLLIRVTIASLDGQLQVVSSQKTDVISLSLGQGEEFKVVQLDYKLKFPLLLSFNFLVVVSSKLGFPGSSGVEAVVTPEPSS
ncbi:protein germ cell-less isoform X2 [Ischnura elegans]|uniref:protein germ cell-less isoform X2 n=1 Tax=Ischnura elegans TaxID=197161 RepID=UPI001ED8BB6C|nr:protein germ cell-less isoform X2 [Ischnura elegans]